MSGIDRLKPADGTFLMNYQTKTDAVYAYLREAIITGRVKPGERIGQAELAETLLVSATPVREAMHKLDAQGILRYIPHHGAQVAIPDRKTIDEVYQVRAMLESSSIQHAVSLISQERIDYLDEMANALLSVLIPKCLEAGDFTPYRASNYQFHKTIYTSADLAIIPDLIENLWARSAAPDELFLFDIERVKDASQEHVDLVGALRQRDVAKADSILSAHNDRTRLAYLRMLDGSTSRSDSSARA